MREARVRLTGGCCDNLGRSQCWTATLIGVLDRSVHTLSYVFKLHEPAMTWKEYSDFLSAALLHFTLGYAVASSWIVLALSGRWRAERGWIDCIGTLIGILWIFSCLAFNLRYYGR